MTIIVEDGTAKTDSNSYVSESELTTYLTDRGLTLTGTAAVLLIQAMDYIEQQPFIGAKLSRDQALQWPRYGVIIDGFAIGQTTIPQLLKDAQMETVVAIDGGNNPLTNIDRSTKREKVGDIEVEYMDKARDKIYLAAVENKLTKLLQAGARGMSALAIRK